MSPRVSGPTITEVTRRAIFDDLRERGTAWHGRLDEVEFLSRLFPLHILPSDDPRYKNAAEDIYQHRVLHQDGDPDWIFYDHRFKLLTGNDEDLLCFFEEMVHPVVQPNTVVARGIVERLNTYLRADGWELYEDGGISGRPKFSTRQIPVVDLDPAAMATAEKGFPRDISALLASMFEVLKQRGAAREIAILAASQVRGYESEYDNWDGGTYGWSLSLALDLQLYSRLTEKDREEAAAQLVEVGRMFFTELSNDFLDRVLITPRTITNEGWRTEATEMLTGYGVANQGRVNSANIPSMTCDGLLFRSQPEINLYRALKALDVTFAPLPVFLRGGPSYARLEPDFVLLKDGVVMVVEVDGDTYHRELPAVAHARLTPLDHEGAKIERVQAKECETLNAAKVCAQKLLKILEKRISQAR